jgi:hypothetical protein
MDPFIAKLVPRDSVVYARYLFETAQLMSYTDDFAKTAARFGEAIRAIERLDISEQRKNYELAIANGMASAAFALAGKLEEAKAIHARHPMQASKNAILKRGSFANEAEFYFAVSDVFISAAGSTLPDQRWRPVLDRDPSWHRDATARREFEAFRDFAIGILANWSGNIPESARLWRRAARQRIGNYDAAMRGEFEGFLLPGLVDRIIVSMGLESAVRIVDRDGLGLMLAGSELLGRSLRHTLVDAAVLLDSQEDEGARADAHRYLQLARQKRTWELDHIERLLTVGNASENKGALAESRIAFSETESSCPPKVCRPWTPYRKASRPERLT